MKIISFFVSIMMFFGNLFCCVSKPVKPVEIQNYKPVVRFMVCSDTHLDKNGLESGKKDRIAKALNFCYDFSRKNEYHNTLDAIVFVGDLTNDGKPEEFDVFRSEVNKALKDETKLLAIAAKNHDGYVGKSCLESLTAITGENSDFDVEINGFHFIGISTSKNEGEHYGTYQRKWLKSCLENATKDDAGKPVFVFQHEHIRDTVYGSSVYEGWGKSYFKDILDSCPQVVDFSGHSHYPVNDPRSVVQGKFTSVGTGSMAYMELTVGCDRSIHPEGNDDAAQAWLVEVDADNKICLTGFDVINGEVLCQYFIPSLTDKSTFAYTKLNSMRLSSAPAFESKAELTLTDNGNSEYVASVPAAKSTDGKIVMLYRIGVYNKAGIRVHSDYVINNYWLNDTYDEISFTFNAKPGYMVRITAENAYGMESVPLTEFIK